MNPLENRPVGKTGSQGLKMLLFVSNHMKDNVEVIHVHIKVRGVQYFRGNNVSKVYHKFQF